jgi:hypothetical protein
MTERFLGNAKSKVNNLTFLTNWPKLENLKLLHGRAQAVVSEDAFHLEDFSVLLLGGQSGVPLPKFLANQAMQSEILNSTDKYDD